MDADTDIGTFQINMLGNVLKLRHTSPVGMAVTVTSLSRSVGVAQTHANTGITGVYDVGDVQLDGIYKYISTGSPSPMTISTKSYNNFTSCRFHVEINNTTDNNYSVFIVSANSYAGNANYNKYNNLYTDDSAKRNMANTDIHISGNNTLLRFTPLANKAYTVRVSELKIERQTLCRRQLIHTIMSFQLGSLNRQFNTESEFSEVIQFNSQGRPNIFTCI